MMKPQRTILAAIAVLALAAAAFLALPLLGQGPGGGPQGQGAAPDRPGEYFLVRLARYLDLTEEQRNQARAILTVAHDQAAPIREEVRDLGMQLRDALESDAPDPTAVGDLVLAIHTHRDELRAIRAGAREELVGILTEVQRLRLDALRDARRIFGRHPWQRGAGGGDPDDAGLDPLAGGLGDEGDGGGLV